jgi:hypothetical protein
MKVMDKMNSIYENGLEEFVINVDRISVNNSDIIKSSFEYLDPDYREYFSDVFCPQELLECLSAARNGTACSIKGQSAGILDITTRDLSFNTSDRGMGGTMPIESTFDHFFLDAFTVIENGEKKRFTRDVSIGEVERYILDILKKDPSMVKNFDPRVFEVAVSALLKDIGFDKVSLSRFSKDGGIDILAFYAEGLTSKTVVVEVKRHADNVGLEIADRLFGVQHRDKHDKSLLITSSGIARGVKERYSAHTETMSFLDFDTLSELLQRDSNWSQTPSGLWAREV